MKLSISPLRARAYNPFGSRRSHSARGVEMWIVIKCSLPTICSAIVRIAFVGLTSVANAITALLFSSRHTSAARRIFSVRSADVKPRSLQRPTRRLSPSTIAARCPRWVSILSSASAIALLPEPDNPVNQRVMPRCPRSSSLHLWR